MSDQPEKPSGEQTEDEKRQRLMGIAKKWIHRWDHQTEQLVRLWIEITVREDKRDEAFENAAKRLSIDQWLTEAFVPSASFLARKRSSDRRLQVAFDELLEKANRIAKRQGYAGESAYLEHLVGYLAHVRPVSGSRDRDLENTVARYLVPTTLPVPFYELKP